MLGLQSVGAVGAASAVLGVCPLFSRVRAARSPARAQSVARASAARCRLTTGARGLLKAQRAVFLSALDAPARITLLAILDHWSQRKPCPYPSLDRLAQWTALGRRTVVRAVKRLADAGALQVKHAGRNSVYTLLPPFNPNPSSTSATAAPVTTRDQCHSGTSATAAPVPSVQPTSATAALGSVSQRHPKGSKEGTHEGTHGERARARAAHPATQWFVPSGWEPKAHHRQEAASRGVDFDATLLSFRNYDGFKRPIADLDRRFSTWIGTQHVHTNGKPHARQQRALAMTAEAFGAPSDGETRA